MYEISLKYYQITSKASWIQLMISETNQFINERYVPPKNIRPN